MISMEEAEDIRRTMEAFGLPVSISGLPGRMYARP